MLPIYWRDGDMFVFWASLLFIIVTLVARALQCYRYHASELIVPGKTVPFLAASALFVLEPNVGIARLRPLMVSEKVEKNAGGYVTSTHSLTHDKDKVNMDTAITAAWVMLFTEDLPEFVVSMVYLYQRGNDADSFFWFSLGTTILHALRQLFEIYHTRQFRPINDFLRKHMRFEGEGKPFEEADTTLQTYGEFVSEAVLDSCDYTADQFLTLFGYLTSAVTIIRLSCCAKITDAAVIAIAEHCPNLTDIYLTDCRKITDAAVIALVGHCPNLTSIFLTDCRKITNAAVIALAEHCPNLTDIYLYGCANITDAAKAALRKSHEGITIHG